MEDKPQRRTDREFSLLHKDAPQPVIAQNKQYASNIKNTSSVLN